MFSLLLTKSDIIFNESAPGFLNSCLISDAVDGFVGVELGIDTNPYFLVMLSAIATSSSAGMNSFVRRPLE
ncbi:hypothetical protein D3C73_1657420 [compost metagenome]